MLALEGNLNSKNLILHLVASANQVKEHCTNERLQPIHTVSNHSANCAGNVLAGI